MRNTLIICLLSFSLSACQSVQEPIVKYYLFDTVTHTNSPNEATVLVTINDITLPPYLNLRSMVQRVNAQQIASSNWHLWATPPRAMLMQASVNLLQKTYANFLVQSSQSSLINDNHTYRELRITIQIERFNGGLNNDAELAGNWQLWDAQGILLQQRAFTYSTPLSADGYGALAKALESSYSQMLLQLGDSINAYAQSAQK